MHEHTDKPCKHDLKVCTDCGDVYCSKCKKEWFKEKVSSWYWGPYTPTTSSGVTVSYDGTVGTVPSGETTNTVHFHT